MIIGIIVGKDDYYTDKIKPYVKLFGNKFLTKSSYISSDVAIAYRLLNDYSHKNIKVDIMLAKDVTVERLKHNDINYVLGHDLVDAFWRKKKDSESGYYEEFTKIYKNPSCNIFPLYNLQKFVLDKGKYYEFFKNNGIPVLDTFYIKNNTIINTKKIINKIKSLGWIEFITKPELGAWGLYFKKWKINDSTIENKLTKYLNNKNIKRFPSIIFQQLAPDFKNYWEIRTFWFNNKFSHAIGTKHHFEDGYDDVVTKISPDILNQCKNIGRKTLKVIPKMIINGKEIKPLMIRIDCGCCLNGKNGKYFLNEIENQACNLFIEDVEKMGVDITGIFSKAIYNKTKEILNIKN